jgi:integrase
MGAEAAWIERFQRHLATERRLSPHTVCAYRRELDAFARWCARTGVTDWARIDGQQVRSFAARSHAAGLKPRSVQRRLSALRTFFAFLLREGLVRHNPALDIRAPKAGQRLPHALDVDQMGRLLAMPATGALGQRDLAIMELLYSSGLRLAELVGLNLADLDLADRTVPVLGKGSKTRIMPVGRQATTPAGVGNARRSRRQGAVHHQRGGAWAARGAAAGGAPYASQGCHGRASAPVRLLPRTCSNRAAICGRCRSCWAMPASAPPRSIPTLIFSISPAFTRVRIRAPAGAANCLNRNGQS